MHQSQKEVKKYIKRTSLYYPTNSEISVLRQFQKEIKQNYNKTPLNHVTNPEIDVLHQYQKEVKKYIRKTPLNHVTNPEIDVLHHGGFVLKDGAQQRQTTLRSESVLGQSQGRETLIHRQAVHQKEHALVSDAVVPGC